MYMPKYMYMYTYMYTYMYGYAMDQVIVSNRQP